MPRLQSSLLRNEIQSAPEPRAASRPPTVPPPPPRRRRRPAPAAARVASTARRPDPPDREGGVAERLASGSTPGQRAGSRLGRSSARPRPGPFAAALSLRRADRRAAALDDDPCDYHAGLRDTVGWSRVEGQPIDAQPHLQMIDVGVRLMDRLAPGLRASLAGLLTADAAFREAIETLDARLVIEATRVAPTRSAAERKNVRLLELAADRHELWIAAEEAADSGRRQAAEAMGRLHRRLLLRHGPSARRRADRIGIDPGLEGVVDPVRLRTWARAFYALAGPHAPVPERLRFVPGTSRASFDAAKGEISVGRDVDAGTVFHELGHAMETDVFDVMTAAEAWREARAAHAHGCVAPVPLTELCPGTAYGADEVALPDHFVSPYVGRVYEIFGSEVVSMGLEHFASAAGMVKLYERDPEHFLLVLGALEEVAP